jgi:DNA-binding LacI/PurR family transcriptional regulator
MMKKATLRDVAKEAGVSVATVSYVLNNVTNQKIPEDTRQRVFEAAGKLQYVQNLTAKALSLGKTNVLGVLFVSAAHSLISKTISYGAFLDRLERKCRDKGYHLLVSQINPLEPGFEIIVERKLDGVFLIDAAEQSFHTISSHLQYGSPLVLIDSFIEDSLFRKVNPNLQAWSALLQAAIPDEQPFALIHEKTSNRLFHQKIQLAFNLEDSHICEATNDESELQAFAARHADKLLVVINEFLALQVLKYRSAESIIVICASECPEFLPKQTRKIYLAESKAEASFELMNVLLKSPFSSGEDKLIDLQCTAPWE